jgi:hypothetical protein
VLQRGTGLACCCHLRPVVPHTPRRATRHDTAVPHTTTATSKHATHLTPPGYFNDELTKQKVDLKEGFDVRHVQVSDMLHCSNVMFKYHMTAEPSPVCAVRPDRPQGLPLKLDTRANQLTCTLAASAYCLPLVLQQHPHLPDDHPDNADPQGVNRWPHAPPCFR